MKRALPLAAVVALAGALAAGVQGAGSAFPGANGKIAFVRIDARYTRLWIMDADSGGQHAVTPASAHLYAAEPAWSPDGTRIAFNFYGFDLQVMNADGSQRISLGSRGEPTEDKSPAWAPDGKRLVFVSERTGASDLWIIDGSARQLTRNENKFRVDSAPSWSPDDAWIAFVRQPQALGAHSHIYLIVPTGGTPRPLTSGRADDVDPDWSPNGRKLVFSSMRSGSGDIYVVNVDGSGIRRLTRSPLQDQMPAWSPDGKRILFVRGANTQARQSSHIYVMNADGTGQRRLTNTTDLYFAPDWQPLPKP